MKLSSRWNGGRTGRIITIQPLTALSKYSIEVQLDWIGILCGWFKSKFGGQWTLDYRIEEQYREHFGKPCPQGSYAWEELRRVVLESLQQRASMKPIEDFLPIIETLYQARRTCGRAA